MNLDTTRWVPFCSIIERLNIKLLEFLRNVRQKYFHQTRKHKDILESILRVDVDLYVLILDLNDIDHSYQYAKEVPKSHLVVHHQKKRSS
jgi:hypothetical protein